MTRRLADLARALATLTALAALTIGIPALLWRLGGPPGNRIVDTLGDQLASDTSRTEALLSGTLLIIAWVCWAQLAYAVAIEVVAAARGRSARRAAILPGLQALAARLVTSLTLISSSLLPTVHVAAAVAHSNPSSTHRSKPAGTSDLSPARTPPSALDPLSPPPQRRPTSPVSATPSGASPRPPWTKDSAGPTSETPTSAAPCPTAPPSLPAPRPSTPDGASTYPTAPFSPSATRPNSQRHSKSRSNPGDHSWAIAEEAMSDAWGRDPSDTELALYWADVVELNTDRLLPPSDPDLIYPGQLFELREVPADPQATDEPAVIPPPAAEEPEPSAPPLVDPEHTEGPVVATPTTTTPTPPPSSDRSKTSGAPASPISTASPAGVSLVRENDRGGATGAAPPLTWTYVGGGGRI